MSEERIYKEESYKGYSIKIMYDDCPDCPTEFYDMCGAFLWEYSNCDRLSKSCHWEQVFGKHGSNEHTLEEAIMQLIEDYGNEEKIREYIKKKVSDARFYYDRSRRLWVFEEWQDWAKKWWEEFTCTPNEWKKGGYIHEMLQGRTKDELIDILRDCTDDIVAYEWSSTGYSQGDYVEGIAFMTKEMAKKRLWLKDGEDWKKAAIEAMESGSEEIGAWMWGDVYGWVIEDDNGEDIDSCWGYYGYKEIDYMISEAKGAIDVHIETLEKEHEERLETVKANIDKLKGKIFIGYPECYQVTSDIFGQTVIQKADGSHGHIEHFYDDVNLKDIPDDVLKNMEKAIA